MTDPKPERVPVSQLTEWFMTRQRMYYDALLDGAVKQIEALNCYDDVKRMAVEYVRNQLATDLDRIERELSALVARGLRLQSETVH